MTTTYGYRVGKLSPEKWEEFRKDFPYAAKMRDVIQRKHASKIEVQKCRQFFKKLDAKVIVNKNSAYFENVEHAVYFKLGMWLDER